MRRRPRTRKILSLGLLPIILFLAPLRAYIAAECLSLSFRPDRSSNLPQEWKVLTFPKINRHTTYKVVEGEDRKFWVKAESEASASALIREIHFDPKAYPILLWRWKVDNVIQKGDETKKEGDDYAARVYVNFRYDPKNASLWEKTQYGLARSIYGEYPPKAALNYIWANKIKRGEVVDSPYTARAKLIAVQSGAETIERWVSEERNIYQDYISYFGEEPPEVAAIAIMTDTDNTGEQAVAYYADITLCPDK